MTTPETWVKDAQGMVSRAQNEAEVVQLVANWMGNAAQFARNTEYYQGLLIKCGEAIGEGAYICDDGSKSEDVLCAKIPSLVKEMAELLSDY